MDDQDYGKLIADTWQSIEDAKKNPRIVTLDEKGNKTWQSNSDLRDVGYKDALANNMDQLSPEQIKNFASDLEKFNRKKEAERNLNNLKEGVKGTFDDVKDKFSIAKSTILDIKKNKDISNEMYPKVLMMEGLGHKHDAAVNEVVNSYCLTHKLTNEQEAALHAALERTYKKEKLKDNVADKIKSGKDFACGAVSQGWNNLKQKYQESKLKAAFAKVGGAFKNLPSMTSKAVSKAIGFAAALNGVAPATLIPGAVKKLKKGKEFACGAVSRGWNNLKRKYNNPDLATAYRRNMIKMTFRSLPKITKKAVSNALSSVATNASNTANKVKTGLNNAKDAVKTGLNDAADKVKSGKEFACGAVSQGWENLKKKYDANKLKAAFGKVGGAFKNLPGMTRKAVLNGLASIADKGANFTQKVADGANKMANALFNKAFKNGQRG